VSAGTVKRDMMYYRLEGRRECMIFQAISLAKLHLLVCAQSIEHCMAITFEKVALCH
jgi:hypothetical protein